MHETVQKKHVETNQESMSSRKPVEMKSPVQRTLESSKHPWHTQKIPPWLRLSPVSHPPVQHQPDEVQPLAQRERIPFEDEPPLQRREDVHTQLWGNAVPPELRLSAPEQRLQKKEPVPASLEPLQRKENRTGLPDSLKAGIEHHSGLSLDDVQVHYHSPKPATVQALAYTQGTSIHVAPGQEQHLAHEAWHVVQQKQGRVQPTMQLKGIALNDNDELEREADVMGQKSWQSEHRSYPDMNLSPGRNGECETSNSIIPVVQRVYAVQSSKDALDALQASQNRNHWGFSQLVWVGDVEKANKYIEDVKKGLEDDEDMELLNKEESKIDELAKQLDDWTTEFVKAKEYSDKTNTRASTKKQKLALTKEGYAKSIHGHIISLGKAIKLLEKQFPLNEGGYSARGRAHKMEVKDEAYSSFTEENFWLKDIKLDEKSLKQKVYKEKKKIDDEKAAGPVMGSDIEVMDKQKRLAALEKKLAQLKITSGAVAFQKTPIGKPRGDGQKSAMAGTNASAYAEMAQIPNWEQSRWEWLHIRASALGGETDGSNLVVGTRDVNTQMMPFESNIRTLAARIGKKDTNYKALHVQFSVSGQDTKAKHKVSAITIAWNLIKNEAALDSTKELKGEAKFNPLTTNASISKEEVKILEYALQAQRQGVFNKENDAPDNFELEEDEELAETAEVEATPEEQMTEATPEEKKAEEVLA